MLERGIMRVFSKTLIISVCLLLLFGEGQSDTCEPEECYYVNVNVTSCMRKDFNVTIEKDFNSTSVDEGSDVTLTCVHDLPNGSIRWVKDSEIQPEQTNDTFEIEEIYKQTVVECHVNSTCGNFNATITISVKPPNNMVIILVCVGAAALLLILFALGMKVVQRRGQAQSQARKRQRQRNMENIHSTVNTISGYY